MRKIRNEEDLDSYVSIVKQDMDKYGVPFDDDYIVRLNSRIVRALGKCNYIKKEISIHKNFFLYCPNKQDILDIICHELLHSSADCMYDGHKGTWKIYAEKMMNASKGKHYEYSITRTKNIDLTSYNAIDKKNGGVRLPKYKITCTNCGNTFFFSKTTNFIKNPKWYSCTRCGALGKFKVEKLR